MERSGSDLDANPGSVPHAIQHFRFPLSCRECGKRKREAAAARCHGATALCDGVMLSTARSLRSARLRRSVVQRTARL
jgi:hypothetical protein